MPPAAAAAGAKVGVAKGVGAAIIHKIIVETIINGSIVASIQGLGYHSAAYMWAGLLGAGVGAPVAMLMVLAANTKSEDEVDNEISTEIYDEDEQRSRITGSCCMGAIGGGATAVCCVDYCLPLCGHPQSLILQTLIIREVSCEAAPVCGMCGGALLGTCGANCCSMVHRKTKSKKITSEEEKDELVKDN